jgi:long-chain acyl-CoA synthetase
LTIVGAAKVDSGPSALPSAKSSAGSTPPDAEWGEVVVAFVVPRAGAALAPDALDAHCLAHIARFKRPKRYVLVEALPKNNYGKVLKTELRRRLADYL